MIVSTKRFREMVAIKDQIIAEKSADIAELKSALHRLEDLIFVKNFGVQVYNSVKEESAAPTPEAAVEPEEDATEVRERLELASLARRRSSKLGSAVQRRMARKFVERVRAARPVAPAHPAIQHFDQVRESVNGQ